MEDHCRALQARLTSKPDEREKKVFSVAKLYATLASDNPPESLLDVRNLAYLEALDDYPAWAVEEGVRRWIKGEWLAEGENRNFVPKPAELIRLVKLAMRPVEDDLAAAKVALMAIDNWEPERPKPKQVTPEERRRLVNEAVNTVARQSFLARCAELGVDPDSIEDAEPRGAFRKLSAEVPQ